MLRTLFAGAVAVCGLLPAGAAQAQCGEPEGKSAEYGFMQQTSVLHMGPGAGPGQQEFARGLRVRVLARERTGEGELWVRVCDEFGAQAIGWVRSELVSDKHPEARDIIMVFPALIEPPPPGADARVAGQQLGDAVTRTLLAAFPGAVRFNDAPVVARTDAAGVPRKTCDNLDFARSWAAQGGRAEARIQYAVVLCLFQRRHPRLPERLWKIEMTRMYIGEGTIDPDQKRYGDETWKSKDAAPTSAVPDRILDGLRFLFPQQEFLYLAREDIEAAISPPKPAPPPVPPVPTGPNRLVYPAWGTAIAAVGLAGAAAYTSARWAGARARVNELQPQVDSGDISDGLAREYNAKYDEWGKFGNLSLGLWLGAGAMAIASGTFFHFAYAAPDAPAGGTAVTGPVLSLEPIPGGALLSWKLER